MLSVLPISFSTLANIPIQPVNTPTSDYNQTTILVADECDSIVYEDDIGQMRVNYLEKPRNIIHSLYRSVGYDDSISDEGSCEITYFHRGEKITGRIIYVQTASYSKKRLKGVKIKAVKTIYLP